MGALGIDYIIITSVFLGGIIYVLMYHMKRLKLYKQASAFRGPPALPLVGNALQFIGNTEDILSKMQNFSALYPSPYRVWLGPELMIFVSEPEYIKKILCSDKAIEKADIYKFFRPWLGNGLFSAPAAQWRVHRKLIGPTFNLKILESFVDVFAAQAKIMVEKMEVELNGTEFQIFDYTSLCTLAIICETAMGIKMGQQTIAGCDYVIAAEKAFSIAYKRIFKVWLHPDAIFNRTQLGKEQRECIKTLHDFSNAVIRRHREALVNRNHQISIAGEEEDAHNPSFQRKTYLNLLMELSDDHGVQFSDSELREEVDTMIVAGNDTSSNIISYVMLMLASYPDVQEKVYQELCEIYGSCDIDERNVTYEDLPHMKYMERAIKETLRLFPVGPFIARTPIEDLNIGEYTLPKGSLVVVEILTVHRSEKYWHDPLEFDPDRFLPEEIAKRDSYCYLPFSAGPRNCIGARFAMMEIKAILATVLRRYVLKKDNVVPINDIKLKSDTVLKPVEPITLRIEKRPSNLN